jgi:general secretion pathway protein F
MPASFRFAAVDAAGRRVRGSEPAATAAQLGRALEQRGLVVLDIVATDVDAGTGARRRMGFGARDGVLEITRAVAALLGAGLPLSKALAVAAGLAGGLVAATTAAIRDRVERGEPLASAMADHPELFSPAYIGLIRAGERTGQLGAAFERLTDQLERERELRSRLLGAALYPAVLAVVAGCALVVLFAFVIPRFVEILDGLGTALPRSTALLLGTAGFLASAWPLLLAGALAAGIAMVTWGRTPAGRRAVSSLILASPVIGTLRRQMLVARFARLLGTLLAGGAPLATALDDTVACLPDPHAGEAAAEVGRLVRDGGAVHGAIASQPLFAGALPTLVAIGEESGRLPEFLLKAADLLELRTERALQSAVALVEPLMIVAFGGIIGFVALSLLQAIYGINAGSFR